MEADRPSSAQRRMQGSDYDLREALSKLEPSVTSSTRDEALSRSRAGSQSRNVSLGISLPLFSRRSRSASPSSASSNKKKKGKSPLTVDSIGAPMDLRQMGATSPTPSPLLSPSSPSRAGSLSPNSYESATPTSQANTASPNAVGSPGTPNAIVKLRNAANTTGESTPKVSESEKSKPIPKEKSAPKEYRAIKAYTANESTELSLEIGDVIELLEQPASDKEFWWYGISRTWGPNNGLKGFFPSECVVLETFEPETPATAATQVAAEVAGDSQGVEQGEWIEEEVASDLPATVKPGTKLICVYPFERTKADELEINSGDEVVVLEAPEGGWWRGMKGVSTKTPSSGWFPNSLFTLAPGENIPGWSPITIVRTKKVSADTSEAPVETGISIPGKPVNPDTPATIIEAAVTVETSSAEQTSENSEAAVDAHVEPTDVIIEENSKVSPSINPDDPATPFKSSSPSLLLIPSVALLDEGRLFASSSDIILPTIPSTARPEKTAPSSHRISFTSSSDGQDRSISEADEMPGIASIKSLSEKDPNEAMTDEFSVSEMTAEKGDEYLTPDEVSESSDGDFGFTRSTDSQSEDETKLMPSSAKSKLRHIRPTTMPVAPKSAGILGLSPLKDEPEDEAGDEESQPTSSPTVRMSEITPRSPFLMDKPDEHVQWSEGLSPEAIETMGEKEKKRMKIIFELIETERDYVRDLKIIIENFMRPMTDSKYSKNVDVLFSNVDELLSINSDLCKNPITRQLDLGGFLIKPVQRICKYPLLLKEIIKNTDENHREYPVLSLALETIQAIITEVNNGAKAAEGVRKMVEIQNSFTEKINIISPTRYLLREDNLNLIRGDSKKARKLFLFNDLVMLARKDWQSKLRLMDQFNLRHCRICDIIDDNDQQGSMFEIEVVPAGGSRETSKIRRFLFSTETIKIKNQWIDSYRTVASGSVKKKKFSETVIDGEDDENMTSNSAVTVDDEIVIEEEKDIPIHKKLEKFREQANKALTTEYKRHIEELEKSLATSEQTRLEIAQKLGTAETQVLDLEAKKAELDTQLWTTNCSLSETQALVETLRTNVKETTQEKDSDIERINNVLQITHLEVDALKSEIAKRSEAASAEIEQKKAEIEKIKTESVQVLEVEKAKLCEEVFNLQQAVTATEEEMVRVKSDYTAQLADVQLKTELAISETKQAAELQVSELVQMYDTKLENASTINQTLESHLRSEELAHKSKLEEMTESYKNLEKSSQIEQQKLASEMDAVKKKAYQTHEAMKKALLETKAQLAASVKSVQEKDSAIREREDTLRDKTSVINRLELERQSVAAELTRCTTNAESSRQEYTRLLSNLEKVVQERHQVLTRKESEISELAQRVAQYSERTKNAEHSAEQAKTLLSDKQMHFEETLSHLREEASKTRAERAREVEQLESLTSTHKDTCKQLETTRSQLNNATDINRRILGDNGKMKELILKQSKELGSASHDLQETKLLLLENQDRLKRKEQELVDISQSEASLKEKVKSLEDHCHQLVVSCERSDTRNFEMSKAIEQKDYELGELRDSVRKITEFAQSQLHQELSELKQKMSSEASMRYEFLAKENAELQVKLNREVAELKNRKEHEEQIMAGQLELVERLEKETNASKIRCEKEIETLKSVNERLEEEVKEKAKSSTNLKKKVKQLDCEKESLVKKTQELTKANIELTEQHQKLIATTKSQEDDISFLKSRLSNTEKESSALSNRLDLYSELDKKYHQLREHSEHISFEVKSKDGHLRQTEQHCEKKDKEIAALEYIIEEISNAVYSVHLSSVNPFRGKSPVRVSGLKEDSKAMSVLSRINDILGEYTRVSEALSESTSRIEEIIKENHELLQERELTLSNVKKIESKFKEKTRMYKHDVESFEEELSASRDAYDSLRHANLELEGKLNKTVLELTTVEGNMATVEQDFAKLLEAHKRMKATHAKLLESSKAEAATWKQVEAELISESNEATLKLKELEGENEYFKNLTDSLMGAKMRLQSSLDFTNASSCTVTSELERIKLELSDTIEQLNLAQETNKRAQTKIANLEESFQSEREKAERLGKEYSQKFESAANEMWRKESDLQHRFQNSSDKQQRELEDRQHKIQQLSEHLEDAHQKVERQTTELRELEEKLANTKAENQVLCTEIVNMSRRENTMRCKLDIIRSKIVASNQNIEDVRISDQTLSNALGASTRQETPKWKPQSAPIQSIPMVPVRQQPVAKQEAPPVNKGLVKSTLKMIDGILAKKTLILRKLVSCEKSILALLDSQITEKQDFDGIFEMSSVVQDRTNNARINKDTALRTLEYLANVSTSINHGREGTLVIIHRARRDVSVAKDLLYEMHEFVRIWLLGFEDMSLIMSPTGQIAETRRSPVQSPRRIQQTDGGDSDRSVLANESTWVEQVSEQESCEQEQVPNPVTSKTPGILLAIPKLGNLFEESEMSSLLGAFGDSQ
ncbi:cytochrome c oxidase subunit 1 [Podochytrium sp. JEL0797]|nr:cytochrome c oxidase subunit 1 [Podochytrium sp. JEL0797]